MPYLSVMHLNVYMSFLMFIHNHFCVILESMGVLLLLFLKCFISRSYDSIASTQRVDAWERSVVREAGTSQGGSWPYSGCYKARQSTRHWFSSVKLHDIFQISSMHWDKCKYTYYFNYMMLSSFHAHCPVLSIYIILIWIVILDLLEMCERVTDTLR